MQAPNLTPEALASLTAAYGTPLYLYHAPTVQRQYRRLHQAMRPLDSRLLYACKANSNLHILGLLRTEGAGLDTVSIQEVELGLRAGFAPADILFTPNSVGLDELTAAVDYGVRINIDNIAILEAFGSRYGQQVPVMLRINPHIVAGGHGNIQTGHIDSKFGISIFQLRHALRVVEAYGVPVYGLHMHTGSDILDTEVFLAAVEVLLEAAGQFPALEVLDLGSGFKVAYRDDDPTTDVEALGRRLADRMSTFQADYGRPIQVWFEPGKYLVSEAGYLLVRANVVKQTVSTVFVGVDSGLNHLLRPMLYDAYHPAWNLSNPGGQQRVYSVVGYICETDTLAADRKLPEVRTGDILALGNAGAYGYSMASNYNLRPRPAEVLWSGGADFRLIRRRETLDDILATQLLPQPAHV